MANRPSGAPTGRLRAAMALVFLLAVVAAALGIGVRAADAGHVAVDEPQYVLTALSLAEDGDLDISDELAEGRWRVFFDKRLPVQTAVLDGRRQISPHDPLLPIVIAAPMGLGGWVAVKFTLAGLGGLLAALTLWVAVRRFGIGLGLATAGVGVAAASAPFAVYGQQIYPELPAALLVVAAVAALTGARDHRHLLLLGATVSALPWLSVKYAPVAAVLALLGVLAWRTRRRDVAVFAGALALMGVLFLVVHQIVWGGWTAYATGDHFQQIGEFGVMGTDPSYGGRALRLVGLLVDRGYGIVAWQPAWLLLVPAAAALAVRRPRHWLALAAPLAAGWLVATFVALTMHGHWWPGRQLVVVLPLALLVILAFLEPAGRALRTTAAVLGACGVVTYAWLLVDGWAREVTWVSRFEAVDAPTYQLLRPLLPDYRADYWALHLTWLAALAVLGCLGARAARTPAGAPSPPVADAPDPVSKGSSR